MFQIQEFSNEALCAPAVFYRTYSRREEYNKREQWIDMSTRTTDALVELGDLTPEEARIVKQYSRQQKSLPSGRWMWIGGTKWVQQTRNWYSAFNCSNVNVDKTKVFGLLAYMAMQGTGTGAKLERKHIEQLPQVVNRLKVNVRNLPGGRAPEDRLEETVVHYQGRHVIIRCGDSKEGWRDAYQKLVDLAFEDNKSEVKVWEVEVDLSSVRDSGEKLKGFGGVANPAKLADMFPRVAEVINRATGRKLNAEECCLLIDEMAAAVVAGNIRRCVVQHEVVATKEGMKPIKDVEPFKDLVLTHSGDYKPVTDKFYQGVQEVVEVKTDRTSLKVTPKHKMAVYSSSKGFEWVPAGKLKAGDRLINIPHLAGERTIDTEWAWLLGLFIADGHADVERSKKRNGGGGCVVFCVNNNYVERIGTRVVRALATKGYSPSIKEGNTGATNYCVYRKDLALEFLKIKSAYSTPNIPKEILLGDAEVRGAFLAGLCDGDGQSGYCNVLLNSTKLQFLKEVQKLYTSLGIATKVHERAKKIVKGKEYEGCHWLSLRGLQSQQLAKALIEPFGSRVEIYLKKAKKWGLGLPVEVLKDLHQPEVRKLTENSRDYDSPRPANWDTLVEKGLVNPEWQPLEVTSVEPCGEEETYDIEVNGDACFIAAGMLVSNSAGMRQFDADAPLLKQNLWQPDEEGNWYIDPKRDALRMANHTRVWHEKPDYKTIKEAITSQFWSGEGAIFYASEAVARCNADIFPDRASQKKFLRVYKDEFKREKAIRDAFRSTYGYDVSAKELEHRLGRYATNPCARGDMKLLTAEGYQRIEDLDGQEVNIINKDGVHTKSKVWCSGEKDVYRITLSSGKDLFFTKDHVFMTTDGECKVEHLVGKELFSYPVGLIKATVESVKFEETTKVYDFSEPLTHWGVIEGFVVHNCGEIIGNNLTCNLSEVHLNRIDPNNEKEQEEAFRAAALNVVVLLQRGFEDEDMQYSRDIDPIIGAGLTGLFDFFVKLFGVDWLHWWQAGRDRKWSSPNWDWEGHQGYYFAKIEESYLKRWREVVRETVTDYCERHGLRVPNRYTTVKPSGSQSLLTNASCGWHPPKAVRYIRRITFAKGDPVAKACIDYGYSVVPSQSDKDENGFLLTDPYDPRCTEWLVEIPLAVPWADLPGADEVDPAKFSATAQFDFMMQVQKHYVTHNTSSTIELNQSEIESLSQAIYSSIQNDEGYVSAALLARFDAHETFPRLPYEPVDEATYKKLVADVEARRKVSTFYEALVQHDQGEFAESGPGGCDAGICEASK